MKWLLSSLVIVLFFIVGCSSEIDADKIIPQPSPEVTTMKLTSSAFQHNGKIPSTYTCDGENINPSLTITDVPVNTKSLVLLMDDPDIPDFVKQRNNIQVWDHWVVFNMPPTLRTIEEGENPPGILGKNTRGNNTYGGPCPPDREHRYFFKLYALDTMLELNEGATKAEVKKAMEKHIIAQTELVGKYERKKS